MEGYFTGVLDLYYAPMTTEDTSSAAPVYDDPKVLAKSIEVTITPTYREGKLQASNATVRNQKRIDTYTVSLHVDKVPYAVKSELLGRKVDGNGVQIIKGGNIPPNVGPGLCMHVGRWKQRAVVAVQGHFQRDHQERQDRVRRHRIPDPDD